MPEISPDPSLDRSSSKAVTSKEDLIILLTHAAELEHSLLCMCLFAAYSLKNDAYEGELTDAQAEQVRSWRRGLASTAVGRMRNLAQISNLFSAIGEQPIIARPTLFQAMPADFPESGFTLEPFSQQLLDRLAAHASLNARIIFPTVTIQDDNEEQNRQIEVLTVGNLYTRIATSFDNIPAEELFTGPKEAQVNPQLLNLGDQLVTVVDLESARAALATLTGTDKGTSQEAAGSVFSTISTEYLSALKDAQQAHQPFEPVRPVAVHPVTRSSEKRSDTTRIVDPLTVAVADLFNDAYNTMLLALRHLFTHAEETDANRERLIRTSLRLMTSVIRPLGEALTRMPVDSASLPGKCAGPTFGDERNRVDLVSQATVWAALDEQLWQLAQAATQLRATPGLPDEIQEATAALQDLTCQFAPAEGSHSVVDRIAILKQLQEGLDCAIQSALNGPYLVTNVETMFDWLGEQMPTRPQMALCRCGDSANKPFCDGSHARTGFVARKDPNRVPDRRDTYVGTSITVLDNRGICAHSGFCTDRLNAVFHVDKEEFVTPNGARMDEIIRAVRACPSGALSYAIGSVEIRDGVDQARPPAIEVSKDGPYRITGGISLKDWQSNAEPRDKGVSLEHYSLCRCGHSQNKPFCSGMHWYVNFHDPQVDTEREPTLFEWAGGLPVLTRMTHLFYDKYIPQDELLRPLFLEMAPDHPERVAKWLGEVFSGPKNYSQQYGGYSRMLSQHVGKGISETQRERWVTLLCQAADEAGLANDAEFRSAFMSYIEWGSRLAVENSTPGSHPPLHMPMPHWNWGTAGPPGSRVSALAPVQEEEKTVTLPSANEAVRFSLHIKPLFRERDRQSMKWAFDLWLYEDVSAHADAILLRLRNGSMPCDGAWSQEKIDVFQRWIDSGKQE